MRNSEDRSKPVNSLNSIQASVENGHSRAKIAGSIAYMMQHLNQPLQVAALAAQASISPSHYFALFKRQVGCPPIDYFIRLRMERARELLESTSSSVKEIAAALGYHDPFYFSRVFKSVNSVAPSAYRESYKNTQKDTCARGEITDERVSAGAEFVVVGDEYNRSRKYQLA